MGYKGGDNTINKFKLKTNVFNNSRTYNPYILNNLMMSTAKKQQPPPKSSSSFFSKSRNLFNRSSKYLTSKFKGLYKGSKNANTSKNSPKNSPKNNTSKNGSKNGSMKSPKNNSNHRYGISYNTRENWAKAHPKNYAIRNPMNKGIQWANHVNNGKLEQVKSIPHKNDE
jgi:hypothetical protein